MRIAVLCVALLGCQGEKAEVASGADTACSIEGNLVRNGDFATGVGGWTNDGFVTSAIAASPCGKALRARRAGLGEMRQSVSAPLKQATRFHLRAMFRDIARSGGNTPVVIARFFHDEGGSEVYTQTLAAEAHPSGEWHLAEDSAPLERDEQRLEVMILSRAASDDEFELAAVSLVTE